MRAVDTSVLVRLIVRDDARQVASAEAFVSQGAWTSQFALAEAVSVLVSVYGQGPADVARAVEMILNHESLAVQEPEVVEAALEQFRQTPSIGFSDCLLLAIARSAGHLPLGTFDRRLGGLPGAERISAAARSR